MSIILNIINYFWKLGFNEESPNVYAKTYCNDYCISLNMADETFDYGDQIQIHSHQYIHFSQKNFIVMESINRFIEKGISPSAINLCGNNHYDYIAHLGTDGIRMAVLCMIWEDEFDEKVKALQSLAETPELLQKDNQQTEWLCVYTSRLKAGIIEYRYAVFSSNSWSHKPVISYNTGLFEDEVSFDRINFYVDISGKLPVVLSAGSDIFEINNGLLVNYEGNNEEVIIPEGVTKLANGVFWNCKMIKRVTLPDRLLSLGGDTFYNCERLSHIVIPSSVQVMGDNPFANCPELELENRSPKFLCADGVLYDNSKTRLIYCSIKRPGVSLDVPQGVISFGKHAFYNCRCLERIVIPSSVKIIENNPFSNLPKLRLENQSPHFIFKDGVLFNKTMGTLFYVEQTREDFFLDVPDGVRIIGRHAFYNCSNIREVILPKTLTSIGYNPFAGCSSLYLINNSPHFVYHDGALYNKTMTELIFYSTSRLAKEFVVPDTVRKIGRSAFYGNQHLLKIHLPQGIKIIERSAFANCTMLSHINIPDSVTTISEWAFCNCTNLFHLELACHVTTETHTFSGSPVLVDRDKRRQLK